MSEKPIGERMATIEAVFASLQDSQKAHHSENTKRLDAILEQTTKTNGRVDKLEGFVDRIKGGWWVVGVFGAIAGVLAKTVIEHIWKP